MALAQGKGWYSREFSTCERAALRTKPWQLHLTQTVLRRVAARVGIPTPSQGLPKGPSVTREIADGQSFSPIDTARIFAELALNPLQDLRPLAQILIGWGIRMNVNGVPGSFGRTWHIKLESR